MSTNFELMIACDLKADIPQQVLDTLKYMTRTEDYEFDDPPPGYPFEGDEWRFMLKTDLYRFTSFPGEPFATLRQSHRYSFSDTGESIKEHNYTLSFRIEIAPDIHQNYIHFLAWLARYSKTEGFIGYVRSLRETHPRLLYFIEGKLRGLDVVGTPPEQAGRDPRSHLRLQPFKESWGFHDYYTYRGRTFLIDAPRFLNSENQLVWALGVCEVRADGTLEPGRIASYDFPALEDCLIYAKDRIRKAVDHETDNIFGDMPEQ